MEKNIMRLGTLVICNTKRDSGRGFRYNKGDILRITSLNGLRTGTPVNKGNCTYTGTDINTGVKTEVLHRDLSKVNGKPMIINVAESKVKYAEEQLKKAKGELSFYAKYEDKADFFAHCIIKMVKDKKSIESIRKFIQNEIIDSKDKDIFTIIDDFSDDIPEYS